MNTRLHQVTVSLVTEKEYRCEAKYVYFGLQNSEPWTLSNQETIEWEYRPGFWKKLLRRPDKIIGFKVEHAGVERYISADRILTVYSEDVIQIHHGDLKLIVDNWG